MKTLNWMFVGVLAVATGCGQSQVATGPPEEVAASYEQSSQYLANCCSGYCAAG